MSCSSTEANPQYPTKDPNSVLDFATSWASWLAPAETITTSSWFIEVPADDTTPLLVEAAPAPSNTDTVATIWLSGGTLDTTYTVVNRITTNQGRTEDRTKFVTIAEH